MSFKLASNKLNLLVSVIGQRDLLAKDIKDGDLLQKTVPNPIDVFNLGLVLRFRHLLIKLIRNSQY